MKTFQALRSLVVPLLFTGLFLVHPKNAESQSYVADASFPGRQLKQPSERTPGVEKSIPIPGPGVLTMKATLTPYQAAGYTANITWSFFDGKMKEGRFSGWEALESKFIQNGQVAKNFESGTPLIQERKIKITAPKPNLVIYIGPAVHADSGYQYAQTVHIEFSFAPEGTPLQLNLAKSKGATLATADASFPDHKMKLPSDRSPGIEKAIPIPGPGILTIKATVTPYQSAGYTANITWSFWNGKMKEGRFSGWDALDSTFYQNGKPVKTFLSGIPLTQERRIRIREAKPNLSVYIGPACHANGEWQYGQKVHIEFSFEPSRSSEK